MSPFSLFIVFILICVLVISACIYCYRRGKYQGFRWHRGLPLAFDSMPPVFFTFTERLGSWSNQLDIYTVQIEGLGMRTLLYPLSWEQPAYGQADKYVIYRASDGSCKLDKVP